MFAGDPVTIYEIGTGQFLCHEDMKFHNGGDLMMLGVHEPRKGREAWPVPALSISQDGKQVRGRVRPGRPCDGFPRRCSRKKGTTIFPGKYVQEEIVCTLRARVQHSVLP